MFGDYEAQRHWMEITVNLPVEDWYKNTTSNNLLYWGLDYPPLTAYHSLLCGYVAQWINSSWTELFWSRGLETYHHKLFMRATVAVADMLVYFPPVILYWIFSKHPSRPRDKAICATLMLLVPGLILIDHGHFQYNCVSLGLTLWAILFLTQGYDLLGAAAFVFALNYKHMELYHALPFFCYLLGTCVQKKSLEGIMKVLLLGAVVIGATTLCWAPFLTKLDTSIQVLRRLFPFDRGLYEDKVANLWCALSVVMKLKSRFSIPTLAYISGFTTLIAMIPSSFHLLTRPTLQRFKIALINSSMIFFLFSFQVHEKSILLAVLPVSLLIHEHPLVTTWFLTVSTFSLFPLLLKDGLVIPFFCLLVLYLVIVFKAYGHMSLGFQEGWKQIVKTLMFVFSIIGCGILTVIHLALAPPSRYPDLHPVLNCLYSFSHYLVFTVYFHKLQFCATDELLTSKEQFTKLKKFPSSISSKTKLKEN
ncbi:ALG6 alpha-1,3-glucosyltransferase garnysstan isoform X2 [Tachypleus tridentatus]